MDKREQLIEVAEKQFAEQGFEAVSVRDIAGAAQVNIAMISYYFGSKEKLYEEIINRKLISYEAIKQLDEASPAHFDKLVNIANMIVDAFFQNRYFQVIVFREMSMNQRTHMADKLMEHMKRNFEHLTGIVRRGIEKGEFREVDVEMTVMSLFAIVRMYTTSGQLICRITQKQHIGEVYEADQKSRFKKFLHDYLAHQLLPA